MVSLVFLGMNEAGKNVLDWLKKQDEAEVIGVFENKDAFGFIKDERPDLVVSSGFEHIVPKEVLEIPEKGAVNLHPSYLPYNRAAHPYIWPIIDESPAGVTIHFMDEGVDTGPVIARREVEVRPEDTAYSLRSRLMSEIVDLFKQNWREIRKGAEAEPQDVDEGSMHYKRELDELSRLDLQEEMSLEDAIDLLRGLSYRDKGLGVFEKDGSVYSLNLSIEKVDGSD